MKTNFLLRYILMPASALLLACTLQAQVTIGSDTKANNGALLDLKEYNDATATSGGRTADKGLGMPRISLKQLNSLTDLGLSASENSKHTGLMVYNTNQCLDYAMNDTKGIYVWDGSAWIKLGKKGLASFVHEYVDNRDPAKPQTYLYRAFGEAGVWMLENMRATTYMQGGTPVQLGIISSPGAPYDQKMYVYPARSGNGTSTYYYNLLPAMGLLYSWAAATNNENLPIDSRLEQQQVAGDIPGPNEVESAVPGGHVQGICPNGWHLPSDREWNELEEELTNYPERYSTITSMPAWTPGWDVTYNERGEHGKLLKTQCLPPGMSDVAIGNSLPASEGGFNLYLAGFGYAYDGTLRNYGSYGYYRTSSSSVDSANDNYKTSWHRSLGQTMVGVNRINSFRNNMMSVRCKKDDNITP